MIIKPPSLTDSYSHVYSSDGALDPDREVDGKKGFDAAYKMFCDDGDEKHLKPYTREGQECTVWELNHLRGKAKRLMKRLAGDAYRRSGASIDQETLWVACAVGLVDAVGLHGADGKPVKMDRHRDPETKVMCLTDDVMDMLDGIDNGGLVNEIGLRVIGTMYVSPD